MSKKKNAHIEPPEPDTKNNESTTDTGGRAVLDDNDSSNSSDDDDLDGASGIGNSEEIQQAADKAGAILEFKNVSKCYEKYCSEELTVSVLCSLYPNELILPTDGQTLDVVHNLLKLDMKPLMDKINLYNQNNGNCFGYLPLMACSSQCQLGALNSQSFSQRVNYIANLVVNKLALKTDSEFVDMLVTLRANEPFINFIKENKYKGCLNSIAGIEATNDGSTDHLWAEEESHEN